VTELLGTLQTALHTARKSQDKDRTLLLGTVLSAVQNHALELNRPLGEDDVLTVLQRGVKQRRESVEQFAAAGRADLADRELGQIAIIEEFLPPAASPEEIRVVVREVVAAGTRQVGAVMAAVMPRLRGRADGKEINRIVREELQAG
jgi:uncharacterized protein YqeY